MEYDDEKCLIGFLNTFPGIAELNLQTSVDLLITKAIPLIWNQISPSKIDIDKLEVPKNDTDWFSIFKNLRAYEQVIAPAIQDKNIRTKPDLPSLSRNRNQAYIINYVNPLIYVAMRSEMKPTVVANIKQLPKEIQTYLMKYLKWTQQQEANQQAPAPAVSSAQSTAPSTPEKAPLADNQKIIAEKQARIALLKSEISASESKLSQLKQQLADKSSNQSEDKNSAIIDNIETLISKTVSEKAQFKEQLNQKRSELEETKIELAKMTGIVEVLSKLRNKSENNEVSSEKLTEDYNKLKEAIEKRPELYKNIAELNLNIKEQKAKNTKLSKSLEKMKEELEVAIQIESKYDSASNASAEEKEPEIEENPDVMALWKEVNSLEVDLASGVTPKIIEEQNNFKKFITKLDRKKKRLEKQIEDTANMRNDLQRVQEELILRHENGEKIVDNLTQEINKKNEEITKWLALTTSFRASRETSSLISQMRQKYH
ncbi:hypothetical protein TVAG_055250 [Trichomonas vaginalis G3]|uniref:Uncharacterized protein n=1 Tax=Trichomonas vaginalis (strain ATCC PRA-98 / G3) TaxID=412133 RepID=A2ETJ3_TRIV3|nr:hook domain family [Trichomonas vaginalis G3]EAY04039.1 hypothetical protein TVAG_055250 [Trichomonas vaginalis G3]KAI5538997.1 hook domain family [Trichomonas vaginalis G3]|eukprot:XP_001316262.1 hypothetical protein [Trichomonas vaginalis G3]